MDELKHGQLDTGSWSGRGTIGGTDVCVKIFDAYIIMGSQEYTRYCSQAY